MTDPARLTVVDFGSREGLGLALDSALASLLPEASAADPPEFAQLRRRTEGLDPVKILDAAMAGSAEEDMPALAAGAVLGLSPAEQIVRQLVWDVELDGTLGALLTRLQAPLGGVRPLAGLCHRIAQAVTPELTLPQLVSGRLIASQFVVIEDAPAPLTGRTLSLAPAVTALLSGQAAGRVLSVATLPDSLRRTVQDWVKLLDGDGICLVMRRGDRGDARRLAAEAALQLGRIAVEISNLGAGAGAASVIGQWLPVEELAIEAGRRTTLTPLAGYRGPRIVICGTEGGIEAQGWDLIEVTPPVPTSFERQTLWRDALGGSDWPAIQRLGPSRIAAIAARARARPEATRAAAGAELRPDLEPHARLVPQDVGDEILVTTPAVRADLELLLARCHARGRSDLPTGPALARASEGVRALLSGPSGGGKTLACSWLATRLGMPLFRVDLAAVVSKYIGETEKNLSAILDAAEAADVLLLFDEADSLFGGRTEVKDSSDRFANNQTNYLLSRIETYSGIVLLTTNGRQRLDTAFARRIDQIIEIPVPGPRERRDIWRAHLGDIHGLSVAELNRLAAAAEVSGGHIRNAALTAAILAGEQGRPVAYSDAVRGLQLEYAKLAKSPPDELVQP